MNRPQVVSNVLPQHCKIAWPRSYAARISRPHMDRIFLIIPRGTH